MLNRPSHFLSDRFSYAIAPTPEQKKFRLRVKELLAVTAIENLAVWEQNGQIPRNIWHQFGQQGLLGVSSPKAYGGLGLDFYSTLIFLEELGRLGSSGFRAAITVHQYMACYYLDKFGSEQQKAYYLQPAIRGEKIGALAITESGAGSDLKNLTTTLSWTKDAGVLNGHKAFVTNGMQAEFIVLLAQLNDCSSQNQSSNPFTLMVLDATTTGITKKHRPTAGWRCCETATLDFHNIEITPNNIIGQMDKGIHYLMSGMAFERFVAAACAWGEADFALSLAVDHTQNRKMYRRSLADLQSIRHSIASLSTDLVMVRQMLHQLAGLFEQRNTLPMAESSMVKLKSTQVAKCVIDFAVHIFASHGYFEDSPIFRLYKDAAALSMTAGTDEIMLEIIAETIFL